MPEHGLSLPELSLLLEQAEYTAESAASAKPPSKELSEQMFV